MSCFEHPAATSYLVERPVHSAPVIRVFLLHKLGVYVIAYGRSPSGPSINHVVIFDPLPIRGPFYYIRLKLYNGNLANSPPPTVHVVYG